MTICLVTLNYPFDNGTPSMKREFLWVVHHHFRLNVALCFFQIKRRCMTFYLPKIVIVGLIWISAVTLSSWQSYNMLRDPTYDYRIDTGNFMVCSYIRLPAFYITSDERTPRF